jgi:glycerol kinase
MIANSSDIGPLAGEVPDNGGVYFVPAFTGLGAPHWDPHARGTIVGLTRGTSRAHLARAALEGIAFQVTDVLKAMEADSGTSVQELRVDGGAVGDNLLMQLQADFLQTKVIRPKVTELTALGAAFLAGLATGFWGSIEEISSFWEVDRVFSPILPAGKVAALRGEWSKAVACAKLWGESHP